jgi:hypothetical protein
VSKGGSARWILIPKQGFGGKLEPSTFLQTDTDFSSWILSLPDLDRETKDAEEREVADAIRAFDDRGYGDQAQGTLRQLALAQ